jgi:hypothetical protein
MEDGRRHQAVIAFGGGNESLSNIGETTMEPFVNPIPFVLLSSVGTVLTLIMAYWRSRLAYARRAQPRQ